jgi:hypothetical protein
MGGGLLLCAAFLALRLTGFQEDQMSLTPDHDLEIRLFQAAGVIGLISGTCLAAMAWLRARRGEVGWTAGIGYASNALATIAAAWLMMVWRILDVALRY